MKSRFLLIATMMAATACGKVEGSKDDKAGNQFDGKEYITLEGAGLTPAGNTLSGSGSIVFKAPLGENGSDKNYRLTFSLQDGGSLQLISHANETLQSGNTIRLTRQGDTLQVVLAGKGGETEPRALKNISAAGPVTLSVDVHNSETPAHVLIWDQAEQNPNDDSALFNSDADGVTPGRGSANFWGLTLSNATVTAASVQEAIFGH